jgi:hypothetical protein
MKIGQAAGVPLTVVAVLISASLSSAQDQSMGDVARQARAAKSQAHRASKMVTNEDLGPELGPVSETDDPAKVVNKARHAWAADIPRTCREVVTNNSGPGSSAESLREIAAPDRGHIVVTWRAGTDPGRMDLIVIGKTCTAAAALDPGGKTRPMGFLLECQR